MKWLIQIVIAILFVFSASLSTSGAASFDPCDYANQQNITVHDTREAAGKHIPSAAQAAPIHNHCRVSGGNLMAIQPSSDALWDEFQKLRFRITTGIDMAGTILGPQLEPPII